MRIIFIRHGDPDYEKDILTPEGVIQAGKAARRLLSESIDEVYTSPLGRARQTAQIFEEASGKGPVRELPFMSEIRYGREGALYESGHPWQTADIMMAQGTDLRSPEWREHPEFIDNTATIDADAKALQADEWLESLGYKREGLYYRNINKEESTKTVAVFCHGGSTTAVLAHVLNQQFPFMCATVHLGFTAVTVLRFDKNPGSLAMPIVELLNDDRHIRT
ncbi:MAG: histidine phosphatase family protein [Saccharofermentans sp.]|nr:histidine phosphatase family protein [Saccharofermentans sp.]